MTLIRASVHDLKDEGTDFHSMVEDAAAVDEGVTLTVHLADGIEHAPDAVARCFTHRTRSRAVSLRSFARRSPMRCGMARRARPR